MSDLPVIDISPLFGGDGEAKALLAAELRRLCGDIGFLYVTGHDIPPEVIARAEARAATFFGLPEFRKQAYYIGHSSNHRGYVPPGEEVFYSGETRKRDHKEAFDTALDLPENDPDYLAGNRLLGPNVWPREVPGFREDISAYYAAVLGLGRLLFRGFALALGLAENYFERYVTKPTSQLRLVHYPANDYPADEDNWGISAHTDYECFTILHTTAPGLQVLNRAGRWVDAPPVPGAFAINIGDMLEIWTNGRFVATQHRVVNTPFERFSFPLFFALDYATEVAPLSQFVAPGEETRYRPLLAGAHLEAQTIRTFRYLRDAVAEGRLSVP